MPLSIETIASEHMFSPRRMPPTDVAPPSLEWKALDSFLEKQIERLRDATSTRVVLSEGSVIRVYEKKTSPIDDNEPLVSAMRYLRAGLLIVQHSDEKKPDSEKMKRCIARFNLFKKNIERKDFKEQCKLVKH